MTQSLGKCVITLSSKIKTLRPHWHIFAYNDFVEKSPVARFPYPTYHGSLGRLCSEPSLWGWTLQRNQTMRDMITLTVIFPCHKDRLILSGMFRKTVQDITFSKFTILQLEAFLWNSNLSNPLMANSPNLKSTFISVNLTILS